MNSLFALRALLFAGECFAGSAFLLSLAWLASTFLKQASLRHLIWLTAFGVLLVLPVAALIVPPQIAIQHAGAISREVPSNMDPAIAVSAPGPATVLTAGSGSGPVAVPAPAFKLPAVDERTLALVLFVVWLVGFCWAALRLVTGALGLNVLRRRSRPHALASADLPLFAAKRRECELRLSASQDGPMTWGLVRPVILLPRDAVSWPRERLRAVLLHELAHVRRRDSLSQTLSLIACALYWPNPLIWIGARAMRRDAEIAADDAVIVSGMKPSDYAGELLRLASEFRGHGLAVSRVSMAGRSSLESRVKSVLAPDRSRTGVTSMDVLKIACLGLAATAALAFARPDIVAAQDSTTPAQVTTAPLPPAPPANIAEPADTVAPADEESSVTPVEPVQSATPINRAHAPKHIHRAVRVIRLDKLDEVHGMDRAQIDESIEQARRAEAEVRKAEPEIERAIAAAKIDERIAEAMRDVDPKIRAEVARAMEKARPAIRRAIADAHISERVAKALHDAQPRIDAAIVRIQKRVDKDGNVTVHRDMDDGDDAADANDEK
jgi:beta-lactamase regulating signal transducer with metallopeptidase domain